MRTTVSRVSREARCAVLAMLVVLAAAPASSAQDTAPDYLPTLTRMRDATLRLPGVASSEINVEDMSLRTTLEDGTSFVSFPDNLDAILSRLESEAERSAEVTRYMTVGLGRTSGEMVIAQHLPDLLPVIRPTEYVDESLLSVGLPEDPAPVRFPFLPGLSVFPVVDQPQSLSYVTEDALAESGLTRDRLKEVVRSNIAARILLPESRMKLENLGAGVGIVLMDGTYEASTLILTDLWRDVAADYRQLVVVVPARDLVLYGEGDDPEISKALATLAKKYATESAYPITERLLRWDGQGWSYLE